MTADGTKIVMVTTLAHTSGQWMKSYLPLNPSKNDSQGIGAAITYLRRYSLSAIVGVVCDEDDDGETAVGRGKTNQGQAVQNKQTVSQDEAEATQRIGKAEIVALANLIQKLDEESHKSFLDWIKKTFNAPSIQDIPVSGFEKCMASINAKIKYMNDKNKQQQQVAVA